MGAPHIGHTGLERSRGMARVLESGDTADPIVRNLKSPIRSLHCFVPENATPEQPNTLAIKLDYMDRKDILRFEEALDAGKPQVLKVHLSTSPRWATPCLPFTAWRFQAVGSGGNR